MQWTKITTQNDLKHNPSWISLTTVQRCNRLQLSGFCGNLTGEGCQINRFPFLCICVHFYAFVCISMHLCAFSMHSYARSLFSFVGRCLAIERRRWLSKFTTAPQVINWLAYFYTRFKSNGRRSRMALDETPVNWYLRSRRGTETVTLSSAPAVSHLRPTTSSTMGQGQQ